MKKSIYQISLDIHKDVAQHVLHCKKNDSGRSIHITLKENGKPYVLENDVTPVFTGVKPDGKGLFNECQVDGNKIIYDMTEQTTNVVGAIPCEIQIYGIIDSVERLITAPKFIIIVQDTVYNGEEIESIDEVSALTALVAGATEAISNAETAAENANEATEEINKIKDEVVEAYLSGANLNNFKRNITTIMNRQDIILVGLNESDTLIKARLSLEKGKPYRAIMSAQIDADTANIYAYYTQIEEDGGTTDIPLISQRLKNMDTVFKMPDEYSELTLLINGFGTLTEATANAILENVYIVDKIPDSKEFDDLYARFSEHDEDASIHVASEDKDKWNEHVESEEDRLGLLGLIDIASDNITLSDGERKITAIVALKPDVTYRVKFNTTLTTSTNIYATSEDGTVVFSGRLNGIDKEVVMPTGQYTLTIQIAGGGISWADETEAASFLKNLLIAEKTVGNFVTPQAMEQYAELLVEDLVEESQMNQAIGKAIANINHLKRAVVTSLPTGTEQDDDGNITDPIDTNTIYMMLEDSSSEDNKYIEWMYINGAWEIVGDTSVDLTQYVPISRTVNGKSLDSDISITADDITNPFYSGANGVSSPGYGVAGYVAFAQLTVTGQYANKPIEFELIGRSKMMPCYVSVKFKNVASTDPSIDSLRYWGVEYGIFAHKIDTSTWLLYATKSDAYDMITVVDVKHGNSAYVTITYPGTFLDAKPTSDVVNSMLGGTIGTASYANQLSTARKIGKAYFDGSANIALDEIMGRIVTTSTSGDKQGMYTKIATIDISTGAYTICSGVIDVLNYEGWCSVGQLSFYFRTGATIETSTINLTWNYLSDDILRENIVAVKVSDGVFDMYLKAPESSYKMFCLTIVDCIHRDRITLCGYQEYIESVEAVATSTFPTALTASDVGAYSTAEVDDIVTALKLKNWFKSALGSHGDEVGIIPNATINEDTGAYEYSISDKASGYIPVKTGDIIRFKNFAINPNDEDYSSATTGQVVVETDIVGETSGWEPMPFAMTLAGSGPWSDLVYDDEGNIIQFTYSGNEYGHIRWNSTLASKVGDDAIMTINEEIE